MCLNTFELTVTDKRLWSPRACMCLLVQDVITNTANIIGIGSWRGVLDDDDIVRNIGFLGLRCHGRPRIETFAPLEEFHGDTPSVASCGSSSSCCIGS